MCSVVAEIDAGLGLVGQPDDGGAGAGLCHRPQRVGAGREVRERPRLVARGLRQRVHPQPHRRYYAEYALGSEQQLAQVGTRSRRRGPADVQRARRGDHAQPTDHVVDPAVTGRVLARRAGRRESADRRELETLREMAEREAVLAEQSLGLGAGDARAEDGFTGDVVDAHQLVEPAQIQGDDGAESAAVGIEAADHAGAPTERHHRDPLLRAVPQHLGDLVVGAGSQDRVGCVLWFSVLAPQQIQRGLAAGAQQPGTVTVDAVRLADDGGEGGAVRRGQGRGPQSHVLECHRRDVGGGHAERLAQKGGDALGQRFGGGRVAPGIPLHRGLIHALQCYTCCQSVTQPTMGRPMLTIVSSPPRKAVCRTSAWSG